MRYWFLILFLTACGGEGEEKKPTKVTEKGAPGEDGTSCSVQSAEGGAEIVCEDGTSVLILNGINGRDGSSCTVAQVEAGALISCTDGTSVLLSNSKGGGKK